MNCEIARDLLLEADLAELRDEADGALARHLRACPACRERANRILGHYAALGVALDRATPRAAPGNAIRGHRSTRPSPARRWAVAVPLALAASLAAFLLSRQRGDQGLTVGLASPPAMATASLDVQVPPGRAVTVFQTDNPNIVVIWSF